MRKHVAMVMSILMLSAVFSVASAQADRPEINIDRMAERLGLDDTQKQAIENIQAAAKPEFEALQDKMKENQAARKALADRVRGEVEEVLTDEQRAKLAERRPGKNDRRKSENRRNGGPKRN